MIRTSLKTALPALMAVALFWTAVYWITIPALERSILGQKRAMIRELTVSAANILAKAEYDERQGLLTREQAQQQAIEQIRSLHYGQQGKDYFWINDMEPRMILHPYRTDLNGQALSDFTDPRGKRLFVEMVRTVEAQGAGYVDYMWQWKDDPARIEPKISYVKGFEPWGWIIGTGIYINDVQDEIDAATRRLALVSLGILGLVSILLGYLVVRGIRTDRARLVAREALRSSEERYRLLVETAGEAILMATEERLVFANQNALELLGYQPQELGRMNLDDLILPPREGGPERVPPHHGLLRGEEVPRRYEARLRTKEGSEQDVMLSLSPVTLGERTGVILVASDMTGQRRRELRQESLTAELKAALVFLDQPVGELAEPVREPVRGPVETIQPEALLYEALLEMDRRGTDHLFVPDARGEPTRLLTRRHLSQAERYSPVLLQREIESAGTAEAVFEANRRLPETVRVMVEGGARPEHVNRFVTLNSEAVLRRLLRFALDELGEPPARFAFLIMGSEGRREQTLKTDQDNAIAYADPPEDRAEAVQAYFLELGERVCSGLNQAGYADCDGGLMARNPRWCQPLSRWKADYAGWVSSLEAQDLLNSKIFFDFRSAWGDREVTAELRRSIRENLEASPRFFLLMARDVLQYGPPLGLFGRLGPSFDIKSAMVPMVDFARIYALRHGVEATNTLERLLRLRELEVLGETNVQEIMEAYRLLMGMRLEHQAQAVRAGRSPDNQIQPDRLTPVQHRLLREVFQQIKNFQVRLSYDFTGMAPTG